MKLFLIVLLLLTCSPVFAQSTDIPCPPMVVYEMVYQGSETPIIFNAVDGSGAAFNQAHLPDGTVVDATLTVTILDCMGNPVANYPADLLWLQPLGDDHIYCIAGGHPDFDTDENGITQWSQPLLAGGFSNEGCEFWVGGELVWDVHLDLNFISADISSDGSVDLWDVSIFSGILFGEYDFSADLHPDGVINLADVGKMVSGMGVVCGFPEEKFVK